MKKLKVILSIIINDFERSKSCKNYFNIMKKSVKMTKIVSTVYVIYTGIVLTMYFNEAWIHAMITKNFLAENETRIQKYAIDVDYHFFNTSEHYIFTTAHLFIGGYFSIEIIVCVDMLLFCFAEHTCGLYKILKYKLSRINYNEETNKILDDINKINENITTCIKDYYHVLEFLNKVNDYFSTYLFLLFSIVLLLTTFYASLIVLNLDNTELLIRGGLTIIAQLVHLFFNCLSGQMILNESETINNYIYYCDWNNKPPKMQRNIWFLMLSAKKETPINVGKNFILSFEFYASIMKTMFSYLNILNSR
ncbi:odorant receptor 9a-like isoform X2 [Leptopilina heterotoma]|nr:odorant receptor 9a-like isoform X2 [Leptopilina heterotoma]